MFKLFKFLSKYKKIIPIIFILIAMQAISTLLLPDFTSKIISEGIQSPAYEKDAQGENVKAVISPYSPFIAPMLGEAGGDSAESLMGVKKYPRTTESVIYIDVNGYGALADQSGEPVGVGGTSADVLYEKDADGNLIKDADTGAYIVKYARQNAEGDIVNDYIASENGVVRSIGYEKKYSGEAVLAPVVSEIMIYRFDTQPTPLKLNEYGNAEFAGFYINGENAPYTVKIGEMSVPVFKFEREGDSSDRFGSLLVDENGNAMLSQVSYFSVIIKYGLIMLGTTLLISICAIIANFLSSNVSMKMGRDIRSSLYKKINGLSINDSNKFGTASLITRTTNDVVQVQSIMFMIFRMAVMPPIMFIGGFIMAINKNVQMTLVLLVSVPLIIFLIVFVAKKVIPLFKSMQKKIDKLTLVARESLTGVRVIRAFNRENTEDKRFEEANADVTDTAIKANRIMTIMGPFVSVIMNFTTLAIIAIAVFVSKDNIMGTSYTDFGNMMAVTQYIMHIMISILFIMMMFVMFPRASASAARINEVLETHSKITDPDTVSETTDRQGEILFDNVTFSFEGSEKPVLSNISFNIGRGETVAVIGSTGSGKSTLINMIARIADATSGTVYVDGVDVKKYTQKSLRKKISFVPQKSLLFTGTVESNLKFGDENADEEKMMKALEIAQAKKFVTKKEEGLNATVEHGGVNFSGGQKQRLSIARALMKDAEIYIFDDSFSALDFKTDLKLRSALKKDLNGKTVIIVSQRIGTVMNSDKILVLDEGKLAGQGRHKDLLENCSVYREIALSQLSEEELK